MVGIAGVIVGLTVGHYRYRIQYVRALPQHKAIVFVRSRAEYIALGILLVVSFASEQEEIAVVGPLTLLITFLLAVVVSESIGRAWFAFRRYRRESCRRYEPSRNLNPAVSWPAQIHPHSLSPTRAAWS